MRTPRLLLALVTLAAAAVAARAQVIAEPIPPEVIIQVAPIAVELLSKQIPNPPVKVEPSAEKTVGYHVMEKLGVVMVPDKNLTAEKVEQAEGEVPVGILATRALTIEDRGAPINGEKLALIDFQGAFKLPVFFLSARASGETRHLEVYSKEGKPLLSLPLKKQASETKTPVAVKMTNIDLEKKKLDLALSVTGTYESTLNMAVIEGP
jgi:hypothetical protein